MPKQTGADREVQRILIELLNQMDGFDQSTNVKVCLSIRWDCRVGHPHPQYIVLFCHQVIMATNRADTLDPALLRPGRLDRKIEFPAPDRRQRRLIFQVRQRTLPTPGGAVRTH